MQLFDMIEMLVCGVAEDEDVVDIVKFEFSVYFVENFVHHALKCGCCVGKTHGHDLKLVEA